MIAFPSLARFLVAWLAGVAVAAAPRDEGHAGSTFHVSPAGDDGRDGRSPATAWRTVARVNATAFEPGDLVLFERGGAWRESLAAGSSGAPGRPIVFGAYGAGPKPRFWGSDPLDPGRFEPDPAAAGTFRVAVPAAVHAVLVDHAFLRDARRAGKGADPAQDLAYVGSHPGSWCSGRGLLHVNTGGDPRADRRPWTVATREDVVGSNGRDHLVFRDLVVDESARFDGGYGFRVMDSADVRLERCEAYRAGKHHFGVINATGFVGVDLVAAVALPDQGAGGASAYVTFSDATRRGDTSAYHGCTAERLDDPGTGGRYPAFVTHGAGVGSILLDGMTSRGGEIALDNDESGAAIVVRGGRLEDATLAVRGRRIVVGGMAIAGALAGVALDGTANTLENLLVTGGNPGFAGYQAAIVEGGRDNTIRSCTVVLDPAAPDFDAALALKRRDSRLRWHDNVLLAPGTAVRTWFAGFDPHEFAASTNFYGRMSAFDTRHDGVGASFTFARWQALGLDAGSIAGDPRFADATGGDYTPGPGSPLIDAAGSGSPVTVDHRGTPRPRGRARDIGAFEAPAGVVDPAAGPR